MSRRVYLDHINGMGNPSSLHAEGREAARLLDQARSSTAALAGARPDEVVFTSSGTEANDWALIGLTAPSSCRRLIVSSVEHASILQTARRMEKEGWKVEHLSVDSTGRVQMDGLKRALEEPAALLSIQWANGEVGTLQPILEAIQLAKAKGVPVHSDAVAAAGRVPIDFHRAELEALTFAAHPMGGPPGVGALVVRKGARIQPFFLGGAQEDGRRAGTENLPGIVGFGKACEAAARDLPGFSGRSTPLRDRLIRGILTLYPDAVFHGHPAERLPGHVSVSLPGFEAEQLVLGLDLQGIAVGVGSACTTLAMKGSHVLKAMGIPEKQARGAVTCTMGPQTTDLEIDRFLEALKEVSR